MAGAAVSAVMEYLVRSRDVIQAAIDDPVFAATIRDIVEVTATALDKGHKLLLAGNGGSAADAQHLAEMLSRLCAIDPRCLLLRHPPTIGAAAIGSDYGYERLFGRQILVSDALGMFMASTSGRSVNILRAIDAAGQKEIDVGPRVAQRRDVIAAMLPACAVGSTPVIQQIHITAGHIICGLVEERLFPRG
jgi:D-sedoheptulose 7-phosphate isomerase